MHKAIIVIILSVALFMQLSGCAEQQPQEQEQQEQQKQQPVEQISDALTPGIFLEETRALIPEGVELRKVYPPGIELTKISEGFRGRLYNDAAGFCTIGYGHLIKKSACDGTEKEEFKSGISEQQGEALLVEDMNWAKYSVMQAVSVELTDGQYAALVDFVFNVGSGNFNKSTLLKKINAQQHSEVPAQFRRWIRAGGKVWQGLVTRREREIDLYLEGTAIPRLLPQEGEELPDIDIREGELNS
ncbi:Phage-related lysozyme (muramidase), GH24 family [Nitrosomonas marina]|uniref:Lysozyme n=1 Tax=Nitrosomonas marina TaxID=917 RepID=A0A1H9Y3Y7_9PROT|nr:lysozyme [Nitrosomonas marina]SES63388.1 Phage-related lysozyme (muramidase), GH24 family [Nitrosomonas marina]